MEENKALTITFDSELASELHELASQEEMTVEEMVHELLFEALEWRSAIAQATEECPEDANFVEILAKVLEVQEDEA